MCQCVIQIQLVQMSECFAMHWVAVEIGYLKVSVAAGTLDFQKWEKQ